MKNTPPPQHHNSLDGLRGLAALLVLLSHLSNEGLHLIPALNLGGSGKLGVFLFFVLSSFLLSVNFFSKPHDRLFDLSCWLRYVVRRVMRIFPLYSVVILVSATLTGHFAANFVLPLTWGEAGHHLLLLEGKSIFWALPVECKYYLLLPLPILLAHGALRSHPRTATILLAMMVAVSAWYWPGAQSVINGIILGPYLPIFFLGTLTAFLHVLLQQNNATISLRYQWSLEIIAIISLAAVLVTVPSFWSFLSGHQIPFDYFHRQYLLYGVLWSTVILSHLHGRGFVKRLLASPPFRLPGIISFSIYLWHLPVLLFVRNRPESVPSTLHGTVIVIGTLIVATFSYWFIERPFLQLWRNNSYKTSKGA